MDVKDVLGEAFNLSNAWMFLVQIDDEEPKEMSYLQLGIFLTSNRDGIDLVKIKTRE